MNTVQLTVDMMNNKKIKRNFKGVFPADKLPKRLKKPAMLIANTDPSSKPGSHWVAFHIPVKGPIEFFDSTGRGPESDHFKSFLRKNGKKLLCNKNRLQSLFSTTCGNYCGVFLYLRSNNISFKKFLSLFSNDYSKNDSDIYEMYRKIFGSKKKIQIGGNPIICNQTCAPC